MVEDACIGPSGEHLPAALADGGVIGGGQPGQLGQVPGQPEAPASSAPGGRADEGEGPVGQGTGPAGQGGQLGGEGPFRRRLERGRVPVPPPAVAAPDGAHDEFRLVVDGLQVGAFHEVGRRSDGVDDLVEAGARVHEREGLLDQRFEEGGGVGQGLADPVGADHREPVAREGAPRARPPGAS